ncbi:hypothetical protein B0H10DRAFT_2226262 [Mycena sp. CBHHK59/15]|nr:hypothetical protein B0H10DRAFT_2226262 [Mycena sp. CBHHK59/15]
MGMIPTFSEPAPRFNDQIPQFNPEEEDEQFGGDLDFPDPSSLLDAPAPALQPPTVQPTAIASAQTAPTQLNNTPPNLRIFPQDTANMSSTSVTVPPRRPLVRRVRPAAAASSDPPSSESPRPSPLPLIRRTNIFGPGHHDDRQRPRQSALPLVETTNVVPRQRPSGDEELPPRKKARKERAARSIKTVDPLRVPIIEAGYAHVRLLVQTSEAKVWLNQRADLAEFSQDAFEYGVGMLGLCIDDYDPVTTSEQDLFRERIYRTRKDYKNVGRNVVRSIDGYDLRACAGNATQAQQDAVAAHNRAQVAILTEKSAFTFTDPNDRTAKGTMYQHPSILETIKQAAFANILSDGMQYPHLFDDTLPAPHTVEDDTQPLHKPTMSLVVITLALEAIRAAIMEFSSGHFVPEEFGRATFKPFFDKDLNTLRAWRTYTSNATTIQGDGPLRTLPLSFLARTFQEMLYSQARYAVLKDIVAPVVSADVMDESDFALNQ